MNKYTPPQTVITSRDKRDLGKHSLAHISPLHF